MNSTIRRQNRSNYHVPILEHNTVAIHMYTLHKNNHVCVLLTSSSDKSGSPYTW